jgi:hypothetical protein
MIAGGISAASYAALELLKRHKIVVLHSLTDTSAVLPLVIVTSKHARQLASMLILHL